MRKPNGDSELPVSYIYRPWITTKTGKRIFRKGGKMFKIPKRY